MHYRRPGVAGGGWGGSDCNFLEAENGAAGTGGGGGGNGYAAYYSNTTRFTYRAGSGGSGIVILRYLSLYAPAVSTTGNPNTYVNGPYRVYIWTQNGSITF
jgi:hypothetical protein